MLKESKGRWIYKAQNNWKKIVEEIELMAGLQLAQRRAQINIHANVENSWVSRVWLSFGEGGCQPM